MGQKISLRYAHCEELNKQSGNFFFEQILFFKVGKHSLKTTTNLHIVPNQWDSESASSGPHNSAPSFFGL
jgi:hypothetical protein